MQRKTFIKSARQSETMSLQITSMADVFIIILVFLLKSYASGSLELNTSNSIVLPSANGAANFSDSLKVEIARDAVLVEGQPVASRDLGATFAKERERQTLIAKNNPDVKIDSRVIVLADQHIPYATIKTVLASAAAHGYSEFQLAVEGSEQ